MTRRQLALLPVGLLWACGKRQTQEAGMDRYLRASAREAVGALEPKMRRWRTDGLVYTVSQKGMLQEVLLSVPGGGDFGNFVDIKSGRSTRWVVEYFSPSTYEVYFGTWTNGVVDGFQQGQFPRNESSPPSLPVGWLDSTSVLPTACAEIERHLKLSQRDYCALSSAKVYNKTQPPVWVIEFYEWSGDRALWYVVVNGLTGEVADSAGPRSNG